MIITCPSCYSKFRIKPMMLGDGKNLTCAKCKHKWFFQRQKMEPDDNVTPTAEQIQAAIESLVTTAPPPAPEPDAPPMHAIDSMAAVAAAGHAAHHHHSTKRGWFLLILLLAFWIGMGIYDRIEIVERWPPAARIYDLIGLPVPVLGAGLTIENLQWRVEKIETTDPQTGDKILQKPTHMILSGSITNHVADPAIIPNLLLKIMDASNRKIFSEIVFRADGEKILPQESIPFSIPLPLTQQADARVTVTFTERPVDKSNPASAESIAPTAPPASTEPVAAAPAAPAENATPSASEHPAGH